MKPGVLVGGLLLFLLGGRVSLHGATVYFDDFQQFTNGTVLTTAAYVPAAGPGDARAEFEQANGTAAVIATNALGNIRAYTDEKTGDNNKYTGVLPTPQFNQLVTIDWTLSIQDTNAGWGGFLVNIPFAWSNGTAWYNPILLFHDNGEIGVYTNEPGPIYTPVGKWAPHAGTVMTNRLVLNYPARTLTFLLNGALVTNMPIVSYFTNVFDAVRLQFLERFANAAGNRFMLDNVRVEVPAAFSGTFYVWTNSPADGPGTEWANAFHTIEDAINAAKDSDTVLVTNGTYVLTTQIVITNGVIVRSTGGSDLATVDGNNTTECFRISHPLAVVDGFTITRGYNTLDGFGGGVWMSTGTVQNCLIVSNTTGEGKGGGVYFYCGGAISNCTVQGNMANSGGGIYCEYGGVVRDSTIISNTASSRGGGMRLFGGGRLEGSTVIGNTGGAFWGGAALRFDNGGVATNCTITRHISSDDGGVIRFSGGGALYDCTLSSNSGPDSAVFFDTGNASTAVNCRIIGNVGGSGSGGCAFMKDCYIAGNTSTNGWAGGLTIQDGWTAIGCTIVNNQGGGVRVWAGTLLASTIVSNWGGGVEMCGGGSLLNCTSRWNRAGWGGGVNCWGDSNRILGCTISDNSATNGTGGGVFAGQGDELRDCNVNGNFASKNGGGVDCNGGSLSNCTISGNSAPNVGGVMCNGGILQDCLISGNSASNWAGGAAVNSESLLQRCTISNNTARGAGAANLSPGGVMRACRILGNTASQWDSGGVHCELGGELIDCLIVGNTATNSGGGGVTCNRGGSLLNCVITNNVGLWGGGVDCYQGGAVIGCLIARNNGGGWGGGIKLNGGGIVQNCTISSNTAVQGGGAQLDFAGTVRNCILYGNSAGNGDNYYSDGSVVFSYTCTTPDPGGISNWMSNPLFVDPAGGDFRVATNSLCIDRGVYADWMTNSMDLDGKPRIIHTTVDIGAYEAILPTWDTDDDKISDEWTWRHFKHLTGMAEDQSRATDSADGTGVNNLYKYTADLDPTNPLSIFRIGAISNLPPNRLVYFQGSSNRVYTLNWSTNLVSGSWTNVPEQINVKGNGPSTSLIDTNAADLRFYEVEVRVP